MAFTRMMRAFSIELLRNGCDIRHIQTMLGHAKLETTAIYTHVCITELIQAHRRFHPAGRPSYSKSRQPDENPADDSPKLSQSDLTPFAIRLEALGKELEQLRSALLSWEWMR